VVLGVLWAVFWAERSILTFILVLPASIGGPSSCHESYLFVGIDVCDIHQYSSWLGEFFWFAISCSSCCLLPLGWVCWWPTKNLPCRGMVVISMVSVHHYNGGFGGSPLLVGLQFQKDEFL
jgi:hypothetical protein